MFSNKRLFLLFLSKRTFIVGVAETYKKISSSLVQLATIDGSELEKYVSFSFLNSVLSVLQI